MQQIARNIALYLVILCIAIDNNGQIDGGLLSSSIDSDANRTACQLIESRKFICENHWIVTADGYIISVQRLINPILRPRFAKKSDYKPIVLQHGLFGSSAQFLINSAGGFADDWTTEPRKVNLTLEGRNLGFLLSNYGYDVWIPNSRGNIYSKNHTTLKPDQDSEFWKFTFDQMISYDVPAIIDYILNQTNCDHLGWIGHSQGTLIMFGLMADKPEYAAKVKPFIAMAPVVYLSTINSYFSNLISLPSLIQRLQSSVPHQIMAPNQLTNLIRLEICSRFIVQSICSSIISLFGGSRANLNASRVAVYLTHSNGGTSAWNLLHFAQNSVKKGFYKFDYGLDDNLIKYGLINPPQYNLSAIKSENIVLLVGKKDRLVALEDVELLKKSLKVRVMHYQVPDPNFSHSDFLTAINVFPQVYLKIVTLLPKYM